MRLYIRPEGRVFETYTYEDGLKRFKIFSEDLLEVFRYADSQSYKPCLARV